MTAMNISNTTNFNKPQYMEEVLPVLEYNLVYDKPAQVDEIEKRGGNTFTWIRVEKFDSDETTGYTVNTSGDAPEWAPGDTTSNLITLTPDYIFGKGVEWNDAREYTAWIDLPKKMRSNMMIQAAEALDKRYRDVFKTGTQVIYANGKSSRAALTSADVIAMRDIFRAVEYLKSLGVKPVQKFGAYMCILSAASETTLLLDSSFRELINRQRPEDLYAGKLGTLAGVDFWMSQHAPFVANSGSASSVSKVDQTLIFGEGGVGIGKVMFDNFKVVYTAPGDGRGNGAHGDEYATKHKLTWKADTKAVILDEYRFIRIESARSTDLN